MTRPIENNVSPIFVERWSPRAFTGATIDDAQLRTFFEAAHWASSAYNAQPWRFIYARRDSGQWAKFLDLLVEFNQAWAQHASAIVFVVSATRFVPPGKDEAVTLASHSFDAGAATAYLTLQVSLAGWHGHTIGGFDKERARVELGIPDDFQVEAGVVIGRLGDPATLTPALRERESPTLRRPQSTFVAEGRFAFSEA
jgi:nitroreductase